MSTIETFEYNPEMPSYESGWGGEAEYESEVFSEAEVLELAEQLTEVTTEAELDRFLGDLISKAGRALGKVVRSPIGQAVGGWLKGAAKSPGRDVPPGASARPHEPLFRLHRRERAVRRWKPRAIYHHGRTCHLTG
jgi:hypothetical protein